MPTHIFTISSHLGLLFSSGFLVLHYLLPYLSVHANYLKQHVFITYSKCMFAYFYYRILIARFSPCCITCRKKCRTLPCRQRYSPEVTILAPFSFITQFILMSGAPFTLNPQSGTKYISGVLTSERKCRLFRYEKELYLQV